MAPLRPAVVVLDQGNTLLLDPFRPVLRRQRNALAEILRNWGLSMGVSELIRQWTRANSDVDYPFAGHFFQEEPIIHDALRAFQMPEDIMALVGLDLLKCYRAGLQEFVRADPRTREVKATLGELLARGKRLGVFSNDRRVALGMILNVMEIRPCFEYIETSESIGVEKPDPRVFQHILGYFKAPAAQTVYVGDDPVRDIDAAKSQGLKAIQYRADARRYHEPWRDYAAPSRYQPDATVNSFAGLLDVIK